MVHRGDTFSEQTSFVIAFLLGILFGFTLERAGFGSSRKLAMQFYFRDMTVLKVMFTAIVVAMLGLLYLNWMEVLDLTQVSLNPTFLWPQIMGGAIMGIGFVIGGYCPGTSLVASATGKLDGMLYVAGALFGMLVYGLAYPAFQGFAESGSLGEVTLSDWLNLRPGVVAFLVVLMALGMFYGAEWLERKFQAKPAATASRNQHPELPAAALQLEQTI
ncbi:MAG: YeeE/YedE family protein [candidate division KSB1 bacterium]|nr:YeeE/YedE family protein [candidate division KSB1 bacterium]MDZ7276668.1 YeeE/YedE family protein [candidate division KSB1 bacterium]MDZ7287772.1 YeeE/YedE family protein [candidate division KSB1 bacterium]MDZ7299888.1 YeeE/YedE family protein [candidate division KSB1 bacterium]MDZ7350887.1 YeeE/YedE family protein [candidate division KSB1 bacterium]